MWLFIDLTSSSAALRETAFEILVRKFSVLRPVVGGAILRYDTGEWPLPRRYCRYVLSSLDSTLILTRDTSNNQVPSGRPISKTVPRQKFDRHLVYVLFVWVMKERVMSWSMFERVGREEVGSWSNPFRTRSLVAFQDV